MPSRRAALVLTLVVLALSGCVLSFPPDSPDRQEAPLRPEAFDEAGAPWVVQLSGGCGMCPGWRGFENASESFVLVVFANGRALRADVNGGWGEGRGLHVAPGVTFDERALAQALAPADRARGETWVHRVFTARLADEAEPARLATQWRADAPGALCMDTGFDVSLRHANGTIEHASFSCGPQSGPMAQFTTRLFELVRAMPGNATRQGMPGEGAYG